MSEANSKSAKNSMPPMTPADISVFEEKGVYVVRNEEGLPLYQYDLDADGKSNCTNACALNWPPVLASAGSSNVVGEWKTIKRGTALQWTFRGKPVYTYSKDVPGQIKGNGVDGKWRLVAL